MAPVDSEFPISSYTSLRFRSDNGVGEDGVVACVPRPYHLNSLGHFNISTPMKRTGELEMLLELAEGSVDADISRLEIVLERVKPRLSMHRIVCVLTQEAVKIHSKKTESTQETRDAILLNNRLGIKITRTGALEVFINGQNQGIVAQDFYKLGCDISYYASMLVPPGLALRLTAGGKFIPTINYFFLWHTILSRISIHACFNCYFGLRGCLIYLGY